MLTKIYIVDDYNLVVQGIYVYLNNSTEYQIVGFANSIEKAIKDMENIRPTILVLDIKLSGMQNFELSEYVKDKYSDIKIILLSSSPDKESFSKAMQMGASAYLSKNVSKEEFLLALKQVRKGEQYFNSAIEDMATNYFTYHQTRNVNLKLIPLSEREIEVITLFVEGFTYKEIANNLNISTRTVETHKKNILAKLNLKTTVDLVKYALKNGIISL